ncbi:esterase-like activity of phytase family protein [Thiolapillus sp.]
MPALKPFVSICLATIMLSACTGMADRNRHGSCRPIESPSRWGALSGLATDHTYPARLYAVHDHNLSPPEILFIDVSGPQAIITHFLAITRSGSTPAYDLEGIAHRASGGFWLVSEGKRAATRPNLLIRVDAHGRVEQEIRLPPEVARYRVKAGLEGITTRGHGEEEQVIMVFQRRWKDDPRGQVKIGLYHPATNQWRFFRYPLDIRKGTGLSAVSFLDDGSIAVLERDNRPFHKAKIKKIYRIQIPAPGASPLLQKELLIDLLTHHNILLCGSNGKLEGMTVSGNRIYLVADDDGEGSALLLHVPVQDHAEKHWQEQHPASQ